MGTIFWHRAAAVLFCSVVLGGSALAQDPVAASSERAARRLLEEVEATYKAMPAYADQGECLFLHVGGETQLRLRTTFDRPSKAKVQLDEWCFIKNGTTLVTESTGSNAYKISKCENYVDIEIMKDNNLFGWFLCRDPRTQFAYAVVALLCERDGVDVFLSHWGATQLVLEDDRIIDGAPTRIIKVKTTRSFDIKVFIEAKSKRILRMEFTDLPATRKPRPQVELEGPVAAVPEAPKKALRISVAPQQPDVFVWKAGPISNRRAPDEVFTYVPPEGARQIESVGNSQPGRELRPVEFLVGKSAPDFALLVREGLGATHRLTKSDLRERVALLHFWSTKDVRSRKSLQQLTAAIGGEPEGLAVVTICQDDTPQQQSEFDRLRALSPGVNRPSLPETFLRREAIDPKKEIGESFEVQELPTVLIIDGRGVVQYVLVGYNHQWKAFLNAALQRLLKNETLLCPEFGEIIIPEN